MIETRVMPPCMQAIQEKLHNGQNASHAERFAFASFCLTNPMSIFRLLSRW